MTPTSPASGPAPRASSTPATHDGPRAHLIRYGTVFAQVLLGLAGMFYLFSSLQDDIAARAQTRDLAGDLAASPTATIYETDAANTGTVGTSKPD